jgi:6-methylsalicylate decarboxylase
MLMHIKLRNAAKSVACKTYVETPLSTRRSFLSGAITAAGMLALRPSLGSPMPPPAAGLGLIDVHHHLSPPTWIKAMTKRNLADRMRWEWTPARSIEDMDRAGVSMAITSIAIPGTWLDSNGQARSLARECNEFAAKLVVDYPGRFGAFATLPLPDVEGSLKEIAFALDVLKLDGIHVLTSYAQTYLGDPAFTPVMEELNRRKAVVFVHPNYPNCCRNVLPELDANVIEFAADTTRAIANLIFTGSAGRFPDIRFIFSHAGGAMPFIYQRFTSWPIGGKQILGRDVEPNSPAVVLEQLQSFYYDTAQAGHPLAMLPLAKLVSTSHILFGSDFPYVPASVDVANLAQCGFFEPELADIYHNNARRLMPELRSAVASRPAVP